MPSGEFIGYINASRPKYTKGASDLTIRSRLLLSLLRKKGRIVYNSGGGDECKWQVKFSLPPTEAYGDGGTLDFSNHDSMRRLSVDWRGYAATDSLSKKGQLINSKEEALVTLFSAKQENLRQGIHDAFCGELYKDGQEAGRGNAIHGLDTFTGVGSVAAGDIVAQPSDTYGLGALSTALGNQGGTWSSGLTTSPNATIAKDWPYGNGSSEYDYLSPKLMNWSSTAWGTGSSTAWEDNCWRVISTLVTFLTTTNGLDGSPDLLVLSSNLMQGYKNHHEVVRRIEIPHPVAADLGFKGNTLNQDGVAIQADFDCPVNTGYMMNLDKMTIRSLWSELFWMEGPDKDPHSAYSILWAFGFFGNCEFSPKHFGKLFNYA
jgi:hypothetical protein